MKVDDHRIFALIFMLYSLRYILLNYKKKLSISAPLQVVHLVGRVIWGKRLNEVNMSKNLL